MDTITTIISLVNKYAHRQERIDMLALILFTFATVAIALTISLLMLKSPFYALIGFIPLFFYRRKTLLERARELERYLGLTGELVNSIQLSYLSTDSKENYSKELIAAYIDRVAVACAGVNPDLGLQKCWFHRAFRFLLLALVITLIYPALFPARFWYALYRRIDYHVIPSAGSYTQGEEVMLTLQFYGVYIPDRVTCVLHDVESSVRETIPVQYDHASQTFTANRSFTYHFTFFDRATSAHTITVLKPLALRSLSFHLSYPAYTHLPNETKTGRYLIAPSGTQATVIGEVSNECQTSYLYSIDTIPLECSGKRFTGDFTIHSSRTMILHVEGETSLEEHIDIYAIPDLSPLVDIYYPGQNTILPHDMKIHLGIRCSDDYGLAYGRFIYIFKDTIRTTLAIRKNALEDTVSYTWDLTALNILPGDKVTYYVEVTDNAGKTSRSKRFTVYFPTMEEIYQEIAQTEENLVQDLQEARTEHTKEIEELTRIQQTLKKERELPWTDQERLKELLHKEEHLLEKIDDWQEELQRTIEQLEQGIVLDQESIQRLQEISRLLEEIAPDELKQALEHFHQVMERNPQQMQATLEQLKEHKDDLAKALERTLELLKRYQQEVALKELAHMAQELSQQAHEIDSLSQCELNGNLDAEKKDLQTGIEEFAQKMEQLSASEGLEQELAEILRELAEQAHNMALMQPMDPGQIKQNMDLMSGELAQWYEQMTKGRTAQLREKIMEIINQLIEISKAEEHLCTDPLDIDIEQQYRILQATRIAAESLYAQQTQSMYITHQTGKNMAKAVANMEKVVGGDSVQRAQHVSESMRLINTVALELFQNLEQVTQGQGSSTGLEQFLQQLSSISQGQMMLNQSLFNLFPIPKPGLSSEQQTQISKLAAKQRALRQSLEALQKKYGAGEHQTLMNQIIEDMQQTEEALYQYKIDRELIERQQKIMTRLLDAQKSIRTEDYGKKRTSATGEDIVLQEQPGSLPDDLGKDELRLLLQRALRENFPEEYELYIREYFKQLLESP